MHTLYTEFLNELDYWNQFVRTLGYMKASAYSKTSLCQKAKRFQVYMVSLTMLTWQDRWFTQGKGRRKNSPFPWVLARPLTGYDSVVYSRWWAGVFVTSPLPVIRAGHGLAIFVIHRCPAFLDTLYLGALRTYKKNNIIYNFKHKYYCFPLLRKKDRKEKIYYFFWLERVL